MIVRVGYVQDLVRYPVKSMAGVTANAAHLGWHGLDGDRRFAFRRVGVNNGFPWLSASRLPDLLLHTPMGFDDTAKDPAPTHIRTPEGMSLALGSTELDSHMSKKLGSPVELMKLRQGIFDETPVSVITPATISAIAREAGRDLDTRRFRPNIVIATDAPQPFVEDDWIGGRLVFGSETDGAVVQITLRDLRCVMIDFDPDTAERNPRVMQAVVRLNDNNAGAYGTVARTGVLRVGQPVSLITEP
ncbi:MAG TPA: MOSC domain-containing protein [Rhizomicrobium sp.]|nr:MOSC domain-containing protein [Rhizomicrobium sp.]